MGLALGKATLKTHEDPSVRALKSLIDGRLRLEVFVQVVALLRSTRRQR